MALLRLSLVRFRSLDRMLLLQAPEFWRWFTLWLPALVGLCLLAASGGWSFAQLRPESPEVARYWTLTASCISAAAGSALCGYLAVSRVRGDAVLGSADDPWTHYRFAVAAHSTLAVALSFHAALYLTTHAAEARLRQTGLGAELLYFTIAQAAAEQSRAPRKNDEGGDLDVQPLAIRFDGSAHSGVVNWLEVAYDPVKTHWRIVAPRAADATQLRTAAKQCLHGEVIHDNAISRVYADLYRQSSYWHHPVAEVRQVVQLPILDSTVATCRSLLRQFNYQLAWSRPATVVPEARSTWSKSTAWGALSSFPADTQFAVVYTLGLAMLVLVLREIRTVLTVLLVVLGYCTLAFWVSTNYEWSDTVVYANLFMLLFWPLLALLLFATTRRQSFGKTVVLGLGFVGAQLVGLTAALFSVLTDDRPPAWLAWAARKLTHLRTSAPDYWPFLVHDEVALALHGVVSAGVVLTLLCSPLWHLLIQRYRALPRDQ